MVQKNPLHFSGSGHSTRLLYLFIKRTSGLTPPPPNFFVSSAHDLLLLHSSKNTSEKVEKRSSLRIKNETVYEQAFIDFLVFHYNQLRR
jgi:hypothetical protein